MSKIILALLIIAAVVFSLSLLFPAKNMFVPISQLHLAEKNDMSAVIKSSKGLNTLRGTAYYKDIDGSSKLLLDFLQKMKYYENDAQIIHLNIRKFVDKKDPRLEFELRELEKWENNLEDRRRISKSVAY